MYFEIERINKITDELKENIYHESTKVEKIEMKKGYFKEPREVDKSNLPWIEFKANDRWGGYNNYSWFRFEFIVPKKYEGKTIVHEIKTGKENGWDATNPQCLIFINQNLIQGLDVNHRQTLICKNANAGDKYIFDIQAFSGMDNSLSEFHNLVAVYEQKIEKIYYDLKVPLDTVKMLDSDNMGRIDTLKCLTKAVNLIDFRRLHSCEFYKSIEAASKYLENEFYQKICSENTEVANCVGHTHIDVAWLWDLAQTRDKVQRSFSTVLNLMEEYPDYVFMSSQPQLYKFLKEERIDLYNKIKDKIKEGRWEAEGAMWVEADCNLSSGESLVRQIIYGKRFFREEFGVENKILWLPDVFGYSGALPQILKKSNVDYFMTTKISWNEYNKLPFDTFMWEGIDGSSVLTHFITTIDYDDMPQRFMTTYNGNLNPSSVKGSWKRYQQKDINDEVLISFGYGDGGGGPTREMLENHKRLSRGIPGCPKTKMSTSLDFFTNLEKKVSNEKRLPKWVGELYFEYHRGTLTSMARNKKYNRETEILFEEVEWLCSFANIYSDFTYPKSQIYDSREIIALNQFHDIIPGSSIEKVYEDSKEQYEKILEIGKDLRDMAISSITKNITVDKKSVAIFNPLSFSRSEFIDIDGKEAYIEDIPAKGYKVVSLEAFKKPNKSLNIYNNCIENQFFKICFDKGEIISLFDKRANREVISSGCRANVIQAFEDRPHNWDAWDINIYYQEKMWEVKAEDNFEIVKNTDLKATIKTNRTFQNSSITQLISIYKDIDRIDFETQIDWREDHILLKSAFPVDIHSNKATYDIQFGNVERSTHNNTSWDFAQFEVCAHKWADLSEDDYGVAILNDCKYGHDIKDGVMRITLLKSATSPNPSADKEVHNFTYSLYPHTKSWKEANVVQMGYRLNYPVLTYTIDKQTRSLPSEFSLFSIDKENVIAEIIKESETDNDLVIRIFECYNRRTEATIDLSFDFDKIYECDLEENILDNQIEVIDSSFKFVIKPYEIKTFRIKRRK